MRKVIYISYLISYRKVEKYSQSSSLDYSCGELEKEKNKLEALYIHCLKFQKFSDYNYYVKISLISISN